MILYDDPMSRNGYKVRLLASHLGLGLTVVRKDIMAGETRRPDFLAKNAAGRIPVLELDDGTCLPESDAILFFLAQGTDLWPQAPLEQAEVLRWMFFEQNMVECTIGTVRFFQKTGRDTERPQAYANRVAVAEDALGALDRHLTTREWLALGRPTIADFAVFGYVSLAPEAGFDLGRWPAVAVWLDRFARLPGYVDPAAGF